MSTVELPLFPLRSVLFPGGFLPLRIFEQRYLTMIRDCLEDGLLGVSAVGTFRFEVDSTREQDDGLLRARVRMLQEPPACPLPADYSVLADVLGRFMEKVGQQYPDYSEDCLQDAVWVGYRLAELLPLAGIEKQHLLELTDPIERLQSLVDVLPRFQTG
jgi:Lon protease-like protein